jgi:hypothetical protein
MSKRTLLVWPNPFHQLDAEGRPAGVLPYEPVGNGINTFDDRRFVGATLKAELIETFPRGDARTNVQRTWFEYFDEPSKVPATPYYKQAIARGEIFAADEESAKLCGITNSFLEPAPLLASAKAEALALWKRAAHEDAEEEPEALMSFSFGPMAEAVEARKKAAAEESKKAATPKVAEKKPADEAAQTSGGK